MLRHGVAHVKQINGYFEIDIFAPEKHHRKQDKIKSERKTKMLTDDEDWHGLELTKSQEILGMLKNITFVKVRGGAQPERNLRRDSIVIRITNPISCMDY